MARYAHISEQPGHPVWVTMSSIIGTEATEQVRQEMLANWIGWLDRDQVKSAPFDNRFGALPGSKFCRQCKGRGSLNDWLNDGAHSCPACDGTGFKELITLEDVA